MKGFLLLILTVSMLACFAAAGIALLATLTFLHMIDIGLDTNTLTLFYVSVLCVGATVGYVSKETYESRYQW